MKYRLLGIDVDGTLLGTNHSLNAETIDAVRKISRKSNSSYIPAPRNITRLPKIDDRFSDAVAATTSGEKVCVNTP